MRCVVGPGPGSSAGVNLTACAFVWVMGTSCAYWRDVVSVALCTS